MHYRDIVIHIAPGIVGTSAQWAAYPPVAERVDLSDEVWIGRLESGLANAIMDTCEARLLGVESLVRQFAHLYAFVRELSGPVDVYGWDEKNTLSGMIGLSRLIHPTTTGFKYAARVGHESGAVKRIVPAELVGISRDVFVSPNQERDWLTLSDLASLRNLAPRLTEKLPVRVHNALWHHEYAMRTYYLDLRWTLVCTGLESFVHTDRHSSTRQFARICQLAAEVGIAISANEALEAYELRSQLAHGTTFLSAGSPSGPTASQVALYDRLERTLQMATIKGISDAGFASLLRSDDDIRLKYPLPNIPRSASR